MHDDQKYKAELLDLMRRVDFVLSEERIDYFAVYGTCLGAVREHGIIPWDDDIDIAVWRKDFQRAIRILTASREQIYAGDRTTVPGCPSRCGRIFNRVGAESTIEQRRAYIDLHVIDYAPPSRLWFLWTVLWYVGISRIVSRRGGSVGHLHQRLYAAADCIAFPFKIFSTAFLSKFADWIYIHRSPSPFVKITFDGNRKRYPASAFSSIVRVPFSTFTIPIPIGYEDYLMQCYGNWRKPPPPDERFSHAVDQESREWTVLTPLDDIRSLR